jgi:uncharacterized protein (UPF0276 family)
VCMNDAPGMREPSPGIGLRAPHVGELLARRPDIAWLEVHPENYMADHRAFTRLQRVREHYPLSFHGVALSLGSDGELDWRHLSRLTQLIECFDPFSVSEHLAWSATGGSHLNDLLPLPYTEEALEVVVRHVDQVQSAIRRPILIENPSSYLRFKHSTLSEAEFLDAVVRKTGCGLLCDVNNIYVSAHNLGTDPEAYLKTLPSAAIHEFHLAGHSRNEIGEAAVLIDDHASRVCGEVWDLYSYALNQIGERPTLIEWDSDLPTLDILLGEAAKARRIAANGREQRRAIAA